MALAWSTDEDLFDLVRGTLYSAVVGDVMDQAGLLRQFLPPEIRPILPGMRLAGRAMTVTTEDIAEGEVGADPPFGLMLEALDDLKPREIYVCGGGSPRYALWGELMATRARVLRAEGAVVDGCYRDTDGIIALDFAVFGHGAYAQDQGPRGKVVDYRSRIRIGQAWIETGDVLVGDRDGVCVVPRRHETEIFVRALEKVRGENVVRKEIAAGMPTREAFARYGIM